MSKDRPIELGARRAWVHPGARLVAPRQVDHVRRARLTSAAERLICDDGAEHLTVARICAGARVSRRTFYSAFEDREQCLLAVFDDVSDRATAAMAGAYRAGGSWVEAVRAALGELLAFLDDRPRVARFLIVESLAGDARLRARRAERLAALARALDADAPPASACSLPASFDAEAVVGAVASILHGRLREEPAPPLRDMRGSLMAVIVISYLDAVAARCELGGQVPAPSASASSAASSSWL